MLSPFGPDILRLLYLKTKITGAEPFPGSLQDGKREKKNTLSLTKEVVDALICLIRALVLFKSEKNHTVHVMHVLHFVSLFFSGMKDGNLQLDMILHIYM